MKPIEDLPPYEIVIAYWPERQFKLGYVVRMPDAPGIVEGIRLAEMVNHSEPHVMLDPEQDELPTLWEWLPESVEHNQYMDGDV